MDFIKKNYEKVLLGVVLLGLTVAVCLLPFIIAGKRQALKDKETSFKPNVKELPPVDMTAQNAALQRAQSSYTLDFTTKHNLFNPVLWRRMPDGAVRKVSAKDEEGAEKLEITALKPLYLTLSYSSPSGSGYLINIEHQAALQESKRHQQTYVSKESKGDLLGLRDVKGPPEAPTELTVELKETKDSASEVITFAPDKPFKRIEGYAADLKYPPDNNKTWTDQRAGKSIIFANGRYNIVAINESNVVVSAESNKKKTTITFHPATEPR